MAAIDKTYVTKEQFLKAKEWCQSMGTVTLENGYKFKPIDMVSDYAIEDLKDTPDNILWNTAVWEDRWLWNNCPFDFVKNRLKEQYAVSMLKEFETWKYEPAKKEKRKFVFLDEPLKHGKGYKMCMSKIRWDNPWPNGSRQMTYEITIETNDDILSYEYDKQTDAWGDGFGMLPYESNGYIWQYYHKNPPTKKAILRQLRKWNIPRGYTVKVESLRYVGFDFIIKVK